MAAGRERLIGVGLGIALGGAAIFAGAEVARNLLIPPNVIQALDTQKNYNSYRKNLPDYPLDPTRDITLATNPKVLEAADTLRRNQFFINIDTAAEMVEFIGLSTGLAGGLIAGTAAVEIAGGILGRRRLVGAAS